VGNKEEKFLEERRYFLERFLQKMATVDFILTSDEFKVFSRLNGDIEKALSSLPKLSPDLILDRFKNSFEVECSPTKEKCLHSKAVISDFTAFYSKILPILQTIKQNVKGLAPVTQQQKEEYVEFLEMLGDYEDKDLSITKKLPISKEIVQSRSSDNIIKKIQR
jgi:sorting nexin-1/2